MNVIHESHRSTAQERPRHIVMLVTICILIAMVTAVWNAPSLFAHFSPLQHIYNIKAKHVALLSTPTPTASLDYQDTITTAQQYMSALLSHHYALMWQLLHPQVQAMWPSETSFATYWQKRFQHYILQRFVLGKVSGLAHWVNPETMRSYSQVQAVPLSLSLEPDQTISQQLSVPPEALHPDPLFQNLPLIVQQVSGQRSGKASWLVLNGGPADLEAPILPPLQSIGTTVNVPILMYHHISNIVPQTPLGMSLTVTPTNFKQQLDYLHHQGYHTITFNQLFDALYYGGPLPKHPIILTFDDGYDDAFTFDYPILKADGFSAMFYIITGKIGWDGYLNWHQIKTMLANGMQIGSHTVHHVDMGSLVLYSQTQAQHELQTSQQVLQQHLGIPIQQFCYPSGEPFRSGTWQARQLIVQLLAADGYVGATTDPGMTGILQNSLTPFVLVRIRVDGRSNFQFFKESLPW